MRGKSPSEHNFSGAGCNFRVFQGQTKSRVFQGLLATLKIHMPPDKLESSHFQYLIAPKQVGYPQRTTKVRDAWRTYIFVCVSYEVN